MRAGETTDSDDATPRAVRFNKVAEVYKYKWHIKLKFISIKYQVQYSETCLLTL